VSIDFQVINAALDAESLVPEWLPQGKRQGREWVSTNPNRADRSPGSFSVNLTTGKWADFASGDTGGDLVSLYAYLQHGGDQGRAARDLMERYRITVDGDARERVANDNNVRKLADAKPEPIFPVPDDAPAPSFKHFKFGQPAATWTYRNAEGRALLHVCRYDPEGMRKQIVPLTWCHDPKSNIKRWAWRGITHGKRPLYGLDRLASHPEADAILVEGEKAAEAARAFFEPTGAIACTWLGGVENADKVHLKALSGRRVFLWPDFDAQEGIQLHEQPGMRAMLTIAQQLKGIARETYIIGYTPGEFEHGWDLADAQAEGWNADRVLEYMASHSRDPFAALETTTDFLPLDAVVNPFNFPHQTDRGGKLNTHENLEYILGHYGIRVRYNAMAKDQEISLPGKTFNQAGDALTFISSLCSRNRMPTGSVADYIAMIGNRNEYSPVADWIDSKPWDGQDRIGALVETLDPTDGELATILLRRWMIGAIGCIYEPHGMKMQGMIVLQGPQGTGKTTWFWSLVGAQREFATEGVSLNPADKDSVKGAISHWLVELGELDATFNKADIAALRSYITKGTDTIRLPYARSASSFPRRTAYVGTVNPQHYLHDETGNRRYWTIQHGPNLRGMHDIDMQQAWAQAKMLYASGEQHNLTRDEMKRLNEMNSAFTEPSPIEELITTRFRWQQGVFYGTAMTATDVLIAIGYDRPTTKQTRECGTILRKIAGEPKKSNGRMVFQMPPRTSSVHEAPL
jgi:hypothetical protein